MTYDKELEAFKERVLKQQMPFLRKISVDCIKCGKTMFEINSNDDIRGPFIQTCNGCRSKKDG